MTTVSALGRPRQWDFIARSCLEEEEEEAEEREGKEEEEVIVIT